MEILYRQATEDDAGPLAELRWTFRTEDEPSHYDRATFIDACADFFRREISEGRGANWIATSNDEIVAHISVHRVPLVPRPCHLGDAFGVVTNNYTLPMHRGYGIGTRLLELASEWAKAEDLELLIVWPSERASSLYRRAGFSEEHNILQLELRPYVS
jgi:GNAT superfamily N-acetyltransferase